VRRSIFIIEENEVSVEIIEFLGEFVPFLREHRVECSGCVIVIDREVNSCSSWKVSRNLGRIIS